MCQERKIPAKTSGISPLLYVSILNDVQRLTPNKREVGRQLSRTSTSRDSFAVLGPFSWRQLAEPRTSRATAGATQCGAGCPCGARLGSRPNHYFLQARNRSCGHGTGRTDSDWGRRRQATGAPGSAEPGPQRGIHRIIDDRSGPGSGTRAGTGT
jgi:hypothetical protein